MTNERMTNDRSHTPPYAYRTQRPRGHPQESEKTHHGLSRDCTVGNNITCRSRMILVCRQSPIVRKDFLVLLSKFEASSPNLFLRLSLPNGT
mmetsp:Transcript_352/g.697  ORF Transcript_352/g.697 Transcript_352/m.697 type:complete len:92 (+) Transcript_352:53-328(+)